MRWIELQDFTKREKVRYYVLRVAYTILPMRVVVWHLRRTK